MVLLTVGVGTAFALQFTALAGVDDATTGQRAAGDRAMDHVLRDLFVRPVTTRGLDADCLDAYFRTETATTAASRCGFAGYDDSSAAGYLHGSLGVGPAFGINVDDDGTTTRFALGSAPPAGKDAAVTTRRAAFPDDELASPDPDVVEITVRTWYAPD
jgi:hypothetical protein